MFTSSCRHCFHSRVCTTCIGGAALWAPSHPVSPVPGAADWAGPWAAPVACVQVRGERPWHCSEEPGQEGDIALWQMDITVSPSFCHTIHGVSSLEETWVFLIMRKKENLSLLRVSDKNAVTLLDAGHRLFSSIKSSLSHYYLIYFGEWNFSFYAACK